MMERHGIRNLVIQGTSGKNHVVGPRPKGSLSKSINIVDIAHPIGPGFAVSTVPARNNLFTDGVIANFEPVQFTGSITESDHFTDKFVTRGHRRLAVADPVFIAPE
jgi:hypothetical protein